MSMTPPLFGVEQAQTTSDDYYTPAWVFDRLGLEFDLDVCAPPSGIPWIPAARFYTMADDGLTAPWGGRVWMNPPFSKPTPWIRRFIEHRHGVCLVPFSKSQWFTDLWAAADAVSFPGVGLSDFVGGPIFLPCCLMAFGPECVEAVGRLGVTRVVTAHQPPTPPYAPADRDEPIR